VSTGVTKKIRVLLAEDHETVRQGLRLLLDSRPEIEVVADARDGRQAVERAKALKPDVVVLDLSMPQMNGLAATKAIKDALPSTAIVALTRHSEEAYVQELLGAGASAYILKRSAFTELLHGIEAAAAGKRYLDSTLVSRTTEEYLQRYSRDTARPVISERETSVLRLMALGHSNKEIAAALDIAVKTVEVHKANGMRKLNLRGRIDIIRFAVLNGWLEDP
jgi:two-component system, NarL family, response regulator NreC